MKKDEYYRNLNAFIKATAQAQCLALEQDDAVMSDERRWRLESLKSYLRTSYLTGLKLCEIGLKEEQHHERY